MSDVLSSFRSTFGTKHRSWPLFWISGGICGLIFAVAGTIFVISAIAKGDAEEGGLFFAVFISLLGIGLLIAVIYTKILLSNDDLSLQIDLCSDSKRKKYNPQRVVYYLSNQHNNVAIIKTDHGLVRMFSAGKLFVVEVSFSTESDLQTFHMTDPAVTDESVTVIQNIVLEKIPVRKNRLVRADQAQTFLSSLYEGADLQSAMKDFSFVDTSEETRRLMTSDAYIVPAIPIDLPKKNEDSKAWMQRKEDKLTRALSVMNST